MTAPALPNSTITQRPLLTLRAPNRTRFIDVAELWRFRELLLILAIRDIKLRYRQTALGATWVLLQPLLGAGIFSFVFGQVAGISSDQVPYFLFSYVGLVAWTTFSSTLGKASLSLVGNSALVSKVYFPRLILPISTSLSTVVDATVAVGMLGLLLPISRVFPAPTILLLPLWIFFLISFAIGLGFLTSSLMVSYRDIQHVLPVITQMLLYISPVAYSVTAVPPEVRNVYLLNPLAILLEASRWSVFGRGFFSWPHIAYAACVSLLVFVVGAISFRLMERRFADVI